MATKEPEVEDDEAWLYGEKKAAGDKEETVNSDAPKEKPLSADAPPFEPKKAEDKEEGEMSGEEGETKAEGDDNDDDSDDSDVQVTIGEIKPQTYDTPKFKSGYQRPGVQASASGTKPVKGLDVEAEGTVNGTPIFEFDLDSIQAEDKPWRKPGADITDYFNYGFTEETWMKYCERQRRLRFENNPNAKSTMFIQHGNNTTITPSKTTEKSDSFQTDSRKAGPPPGRKMSGTIDVIGSSSTRRPTMDFFEQQQHVEQEAQDTHSYGTPFTVPPPDGSMGPPMSGPPPNITIPPPNFSMPPPVMHPAMGPPPPHMGPPPHPPGPPPGMGPPPGFHGGPPPTDRYDNFFPGGPGGPPPRGPPPPGFGDRPPFGYEGFGPPPPFGGPPPRGPGDFRGPPDTFNRGAPWEFHRSDSDFSSDEDERLFGHGRRQDRRAERRDRSDREPRSRSRERDRDRDRERERLVSKDRDAGRDRDRERDRDRDKDRERRHREKDRDRDSHRSREKDRDREERPRRSASRKHDEERSSSKHKKSKRSRHDKSPEKEAPPAAATPENRTEEPPAQQS